MTVRILTKFGIPCVWLGLAPRKWIPFGNFWPPSYTWYVGEGGGRESERLPLSPQGNIQFAESEDESLIISNSELVPVITELLATPPGSLEKALCYRVVGNKHGAIDKMHTVDQAVYGRNAFAKVGVVMRTVPLPRWVWL